MALRVAKGDLVAVVSGDDRGKRGRVLRVLTREKRVLVEGVNLVYKHLRKSQKNPQGGRIRREAPIHVSNVMPIDPEANEPTRVRRGAEDGRRVRIAVRSGAVIGARGAGKADAKSKGGDAGKSEG